MKSSKIVCDPKTKYDRDHGREKNPECLGLGPHTTRCYQECVLWRKCLRIKKSGGVETGEQAERARPHLVLPLPVGLHPHRVGLVYGVEDIFYYGGHPYAPSHDPGLPLHRLAGYEAQEDLFLLSPRAVNSLSPSGSLLIQGISQKPSQASRVLALESLIPAARVRLIPQAAALCQLSGPKSSGGGGSDRGLISLIQQRLNIGTSTLF